MRNLRLIIFISLVFLAAMILPKDADDVWEWLDKIPDYPKE